MEMSTREQSMDDACLRIHCYPHQLRSQFVSLLQSKSSNVRYIFHDVHCMCACVFPKQLFV